MIRSKIDPSTVKDLAWKDYVKLFEKDVKQAKEKGIAKVPLIMISDFKFACGETHALMLLGKQSEMTKFFKSLKADSERKKLKDFSIGFCHLDKEEDGNHTMRIAIEGFGKPNQMKKNSKKLLKKLGIKLKDIIKGQYTDEVVQNIEKENSNLTEEEQQEQQALDQKAKNLEEQDSSDNDSKKLGKVAKEFVEANKEMTTNVISLLKQAQSEVVAYTTAHIDVAEKAFRAAASLIDKYDEVSESGKNLSKSAKKVTTIKDSIVTNNLVKKYETIWKKVTQEYNKQMDSLSDDFKTELEEFNKLMEEIEQEASSK